MFLRKFLFGRSAAASNAAGVCSGDLYRPGKSYGFVTEENRREQELLRITELNSAFDTVYWYQDKNITVIEEDGDGCFVDSDRAIALLEERENQGNPQENEASVGKASVGKASVGKASIGKASIGKASAGTEHRRIPLCFKTDVPRQGNYKVVLTIRTREEMKDVLIFTGRRRLAFRGTIPADTVFTHSMTVNVCDIVPRGQTRMYQDTTLDITVVADKPRISSLSVTEISCPVIYIAGDSTVTDQSADYPYAPGTSYCGWGQMISAYFNERIAVSNHSHSGLTTDSFRKEGHYAVIEQYSRPGDFFFFQFGHNDQKLEELKAGGGYQSNLIRYINECRSKGAHPVLVTPVARNTWKGNDGSYNDLLAEYAQVCLEVGERLEVPVLDLHGLSMEFIKERGLEASKAYFFPNDYTHSNDYGAYKMAGFVADEIVRVCTKSREQAYRFLAGCVTKGFGEWRVTGEIVLPKKPAVFADMINPNEGAKLLSDVENLDKTATRADVLDMIIKTVRFFPTNVYNDMFVDVVGHEWYAGTVECAYQNGMIDVHLVENEHFYPERDVTLEEFLIFAMNGYQSRKAFPADKPCAYEDGQGKNDTLTKVKCHKYAVPFVRGACAIGLIPADGSADLSRSITRGEAVEMCRRLGV